MSVAGHRTSKRGFTLIEALLALLLASILFAGIALYTGSWAGQWHRITLLSANQDVAAIVLDRMVEEIEAAQPALIFDGGAVAGTFEGNAQSVSFVRPALGFERRAGLDRVTYGYGSIDGEPAIMRMRRDYGPDAARGGKDLPLIRGDVRLSLSYRAADGAFVDEWTDQRALPSLVRIEISGSSPRPWQQAAYARPRAEMPAACATQELVQECLRIMDRSG